MKKAALKVKNDLQAKGAALQSALRSSAGAMRRKAEPALPLTSLGRLGDLEVRLARNAAEIRRAQALRYKVFYKEMKAKPNVRAKILRRDADRLDPYCDHVLVLDHSEDSASKPRKRPKVVGTYRLLRQEIAEKSGGFYSEDEYDLAPLLARHKDLKFLELGRSCVLKPYRNKKTVELLWHGVWTYILAHKMDVMIGCASLEGADLSDHAQALSFLKYNHSTTDEWDVRALAERSERMNIVPKDQVELKAAVRSLPPLVKGYLRLGAMIGDGAVVDKQFNTVDVIMVLPVKNISPKYIGYFGADATRYAEKST